MLLVIISVCVLILGIVLSIIYCHKRDKALAEMVSTGKFDSKKTYGFLESIADILFPLGMVATVCVVVFTTISHATADIHIKDYTFKQEMLNERLNNKSENDTTIYSDIEDWNARVIHRRNLNDSIWLSWFILDKEVDACEIIDISSMEK